MREIKAEKKPKITISTKEPEDIGDVFDISKIQQIDKKTMSKLYSKFFEQHKEKLLNLALSRIALDSAMISIESSFDEHMSGSPITLRDEEITSKIDTAFSKSVIMYALDCAMSEFILDPAIRQEYTNNFLNQTKTPLVREPNGERSPLGIVTSRGGSSDSIHNIVENLQHIIADRTGLVDNSPSPYGNVKKPKTGSSASNRKLPEKPGVVNRKRNKRG